MVNNSTKFSQRNCFMHWEWKLDFCQPEKLNTIVQLLASPTSLVVEEIANKQRVHLCPCFLFRRCLASDTKPFCSRLSFSDLKHLARNFTFGGELGTVIVQGWVIVYLLEICLIDVLLNLHWADPAIGIPVSLVWDVWVVYFRLWWRLILSVRDPEGWIALWQKTTISCFST